MASQNRTHASDRGKAVVDIPGIPNIGTATTGPESATVEFTANAKGGAATSWTALSNPGSITGTGSSSPITVSGLISGTSYTFTVKGTNSTGSGEYSLASNSITALAGTAFESIATVTVGAGTSSTITFSSIPSTYKHLQIRAIAHANYNSAPGLSIYMNFNADSGANYSSHQLRGDGAVTEAIYQANGTKTFFPRVVPDVNANSSIMAGMICDILDYTNTNKYKTIKSLNGYETNSTTSGYISLNSGSWRSTSAISTIDITTDSNFMQYSSFALYGIKG